MVPRAHRLTDRARFGQAVRRGRRAGSATVVVHLADAALAASGERRTAPADSPAQVGFVVNRAVGGAVVRNRVRRRLRHLVRDRLDQLPAGSVLVVRALPAASTATAHALGSDLDHALRRVLSRLPGGDR